VSEKPGELALVLITRRAEFHGLCPWVNGNSPIGRQALACGLERVPRALPVGIYENLQWASYVDGEVSAKPEKGELLILLLSVQFFGGSQELEE